MQVIRLIIGNGSDILSQEVNVQNTSRLLIEISKNLHHFNYSTKPNKAHMNKLALVMSHSDRSMEGAIRELTFCTGLARQGIEVKVFRGHKGSTVEKELLLNDTIETIFCPVNNPAAIPHRQTSDAMATLINEFNPDTIIYKGLNYNINRFIQSKINTKFYGFIVGGDVVDPILGGASFVFGEYGEQLNTFFSRFVRRNSAFLMPKYIDFTLATTSDIPHEKPYDIINVGSFYEKRKNQVDLLPFSDRYRIAFVGGGSPSPEFLDSIKNKENVTFLGKLNRQGVFNALNKSKIMVHTSMMDGLPRSIIEAMACGLPVIAYHETILGGFNQGEHGFLVQKHALPPAIDLLLMDSNVRAALGKRAKRYVEKNHGTNAILATAKAFINFCSSTKGLAEF